MVTAATPTTLITRVARWGEMYTQISTLKNEWGKCKAKETDRFDWILYNFSRVSRVSFRKARI